GAGTARRSPARRCRNHTAGANDGMLEVVLVVPVIEILRRLRTPRLCSIFGTEPPMYFDRRLWQLTRGFRGWIALTILLGLVASVVGIARFAILGVLLSRVFDGAGFVAIAIPSVGVAIAVLLRGLSDHHRAIISH